jgi:DNA-binding response OmpR family regulator
VEDDAMPSKHVLLVDDDPTLLGLLELWLVEAGYSVAACERFEDAREQLERRPPDFLVTDVRLGAFNGLQLAILAKAASPATVVLVVSAYDDPTLRLEASRCGAMFMTKPFCNDDVLLWLDNAARTG